MTESKCSKCKEVKPVSEFYSDRSRSTGIGSRCKPCARLESRNWAKRNRDKCNEWGRASSIRIRERNHNKLYDFLSMAVCEDCDIDNPLVLEFHHVTDKDYNVAQIMHWSWERILEEINKCIILCANCHRIRTMREGNHWRYRIHVGK